MPSGIVGQPYTHSPLTQMRGLAALMVVFSHALVVFPLLGGFTEYRPFTHMPSAWTFLNALIVSTIGNGNLAVMFFFVLSGYVLAVSSRNQTWFTFLNRRFWRLFPTNAVVLLVYAGVLMLMPLPLETHGITSRDFATGYHAPDFQEFLINLFFIKGTVNHVTWALTYEVLASLWLFPAMILMRKIGPSWSLGVMGILMVLDVAKASMFNIFEYQWIFYLGALLGVHSPSSTIKSFFSAMWPAFLLLGCLIQGLVPDINRNTFYHTVRIVEVLGSVSVLIPLMDKQAVQGILGSALEVLGKATYSFYLINPLVLFLTAAVLVRACPSFLLAHPVAGGFGLAVLSIGFTLPIAALLYVYVEKYFISLGRSWAQLRHQTKQTGPRKGKGRCRS